MSGEANNCFGKFASISLSSSNPAFLAISWWDLCDKLRGFRKAVFLRILVSKTGESLVITRFEWTIKLGIS
jgi:hypothetical protein